MGETVGKALFGASEGELREVMVGLGQAGYRAAQVGEALYRQRVTALDEVTTLPAGLRARMVAEGYTVGLPEIVQAARSVDGTERYLVRMADGETVETVWMPGGDGGEQGDGTAAADDEETGGDGYKRATICVSSQVGCAVNCQFCLTAKLGIKRNLTVGEIAGQVAAVLNRQRVEVGRDRVNLVFMGMGEPFLNYAAFMGAVRLLAGPMGIAESRMTVSTSGILPGIEAFAGEMVRPKLAVSLNASNDGVREGIMPITRKWPIASLLKAVGAVPLRAKERVTFEYVLLGGVNDRLDHAGELVGLLGGMRAKVNLIVWNPGPGMEFRQPLDGDVVAFQERLRGGGVPAYIRRPRGRDIYAACGQLKRTVEVADGLVRIGG